MRAPAILFALLLAGCLRVGPGEDLHLVCERKSTSPWHPYSPEEIRSLARTNGIPPASVYTEIADSILTLGARPYATFDARLDRAAEPGAWWFEANGTIGNVTDRYALTLPLANATLEAPESVAAPARAVAEREPALADRLAGDPRATWTAEHAGCVRLAYASVDVVVNVDKAQVVSIDDR